MRRALLLTGAMAVLACGSSSTSGGKGGTGGAGGEIWGSSSSSSGTASSSSGTTSSGSSSSSSGSSSDPAQLCVDTINMYRATLGLAAYTRWSAEEVCATGQGAADAISMTPHSAFGQCSESAQDECPGWPGPPGSMIQGCLQMMWAEGPGADFNTHGHYINMSSTSYTAVSCGFSVQGDGSVWAVQDFH